MMTTLLKIIFHGPASLGCSIGEARAKEEAKRQMGGHGDPGS